MAGSREEAATLLPCKRLSGCGRALPEGGTAHGTQCPARYRVNVDLALAEARKGERERAARVAAAHKGAGERNRKARGFSMRNTSEEGCLEIYAEERGEDIASDCIAAAIRALPEEE